MTAPLAQARKRVSPTALLVAATGLLAGGAAVAGWLGSERLAALAERLDAQGDLLRAVHAEVTRIRVEQTATAKGPLGLLEKLRTYAPLLANSRTPQPDFEFARKEMDAILLAFAAIGPDAWAPVANRLGELRGDRDYDEIRWLLRAAARIDAARGKELLKDVLAGVRHPGPRLRWFAAAELTELDRPLAQQLLRRILKTESARGLDPARAQAYGVPIPDQAALATSGFHNFVTHYVRTEDPEMEDTLLAVLGRVEHDAVTIQECVEALGKLRSVRAVEVIEGLYRNPPLQQQNPIFLARCLDALVEIQRDAARPFLEAMLPKAPSDITAQHIQFLLNKIARGDFAAGNQAPRNSIAPPGRK